jgi:hypothetical protein
MSGHVRGALKDQGVIDTARRAAHQFSGLSGVTDDAASLAAAAWWWCKVYVKFVHHELILRQRLGEAGHLQGLIAPEILIRMDPPEGDCAIFSECLGAFLTVYGIPFEWVTVAVNPNEPDIYSHVFIYGVMPDGSRLPLDASHGDYPGWQVPSGRVFRRQVWDSSGRPVTDKGNRFDGLHNYGWRGGMGDDTSGDFGGEYSPAPPVIDTGQQPAILTQNSNVPFVDYTGGAGQIPVGATVAPAQNSAQWASFASNLAKMGFSLAAIQNIQPGTVVGADGTILRQNPGYAVGTPTLSANIGGIPTSTILLLVLGLGALMVLKK